MAKNKKRTGDEKACPMHKTSIGGQALMEGIMMRGPQVTAMAVRNPQGEIVVESFPTTTSKRPAICRWPIIRGVLGFIDSMSLGYKCLMRSAEISGLEEIEAEIAEEKARKKAAKAAKKAAKKGDPLPETEAISTASVEAPTAEATETIEATDSAEMTATAETADTAEVAATVAPAEAEKKETPKSAMTTVIMVVSMVLAFALAIGLFFFLPTLLFKWLSGGVTWIDGENRYVQSIFESIIRVILLIGYMSLMLLMKDIRRTFQFHGAEHKTIFCYEKGLELTVENVRCQRRFHPRCGTSFLILMVLVGILIGFLIPPGLPVWLRTIIKLLLLPLTMGIGYELIKFCGRHDNLLTRIIAAPGMWFQHITVWEPDDSMIECAIAAFKEVIPDEEKAPTAEQTVD